MNKYVFRPYDPIFVKLFNNEKIRLQKFLGDEVLIEHVGSTSVPGLGGKGFIDIAIATDKNKLREISAKLVEMGYEYRPEVGTDERWYHSRDEFISDTEERKFHIHLTFKDSKDWIEMLEFRNYLRVHPADMKKYADIKKHAAEISNEDRVVYVKTKDPLILEILEKITKLK